MLSDEKIKEIKIFSIQTKIEIVKMIAKLGIGHLGGSLSVTDLLSVLYCEQMKYDPQNPKWEARDYLIMSKGHAGPAVYATLALKGFFPLSELSTLNRPHTNLPSHCDRLKTPGVDMTCGSLGQGASVAAGLAYGLKLDRKSNYVYAVMGDGEINEGQVWEAALFASQKKLDNLIGFVDCNRLQLDGWTDDICCMGDIAQKYAAFGWFALTVDGHDVKAINKAIESAKAHEGQPSMIVLNTIKGKGWSKAENRIDSHSRGFTEGEFTDAMNEMEAELAGCKQEGCS
jgi:transketolase